MILDFVNKGKKFEEIPINGKVCLVIGRQEDAVDVVGNIFAELMNFYMSDNHPTAASGTWINFAETRSDNSRKPEGEKR